MVVIVKKRNHKGAYKSPDTVRLLKCYEIEAKLVAAWVTERTTRLPIQQYTLSSILFDDFSEWLLDHEDDAAPLLENEWDITRQRLGFALRKLGYVSMKDGHGHRAMRAIGLKEVSRATSSAN